MFWRNAMFSREKTFIVVEITLFLLAWAWPLVNEKLQNASRPLNPDLFFSNSWARKTCLCPYVTESGIRLLTALKPIKSQGWWKEKFAYFLRLSKEELEEISCSKASSPPPQSVGKSFFGRGRGWVHAERAQSALTVILKLVMRWSDQHHLDCLKNN